MIVKFCKAGGNSGNLCYTPCIETLTEGEIKMVNKLVDYAMVTIVTSGLISVIICLALLHS